MDFTQINADISRAAAAFFSDFRWWIIVGGGLVAISVSKHLTPSVNKERWDDEFEPVQYYDKQVSFVAGAAYLFYGTWLLDHAHSYAGMFAISCGSMALQNWWEAHTDEEVFHLGLHNFLHGLIAMIGGFFAQKFLAGPSAFERVGAFILGFTVTLGIVRLTDPDWLADKVSARIELRKTRADIKERFFRHKRAEADAAIHKILSGETEKT